MTETWIWIKPGTHASARARVAKIPELGDVIVTTGPDYLSGRSWRIREIREIGGEKLFCLEAW